MELLLSRLRFKLDTPMQWILTILTLAGVAMAAPGYGLAADARPQSSRIAFVAPESADADQATFVMRPAEKSSAKLTAGSKDETRAKLEFLTPTPRMQSWIEAAPSLQDQRTTVAADGRPVLRIASRPQSLATSLVVKREVKEARASESRIAVRRAEPEAQSEKVAALKLRVQRRLPEPPPVPEVVPQPAVVDKAAVPVQVIPQSQALIAGSAGRQATPNAEAADKPQQEIRSERSQQIAARNTRPEVAVPRSRVVASEPPVGESRILPKATSPALPAKAVAATTPSSSTELQPVAVPVPIAAKPPVRQAEPTPQPSPLPAINRFPAPVAYRTPVVPPTPNRGYYIPANPSVPFGGHGPSAGSTSSNVAQQQHYSARSSASVYSPPMSAPSLAPDTINPFRQASFSSSDPDTLPAPNAATMPHADQVVPPAARFEHGELVAGPSNSSCEACGMPCSSCTGPCWIVNADAMFLGRDDPDTRTSLVTRFQAVPPSVSEFTPSDASLGTGFGYRLGIARQICDGSSVSVQYFRVDSWSQHESFFGDLEVLGNDVGNPALAEWSYASDLTNVEINGRYAVSPWFGLIGGFRWIELDEHARLSATGPLIASFDRRVSTDNTLLGGQIGFDYLIFDRGGVFRVDTVLKAGVFNNEMDLSTGGFGVGRRTENHVAAAGDFQLRGIWQITPSLSITGGYYLLALSDLALAPEQFDDPSNINNDGDLIIQGGTLGLMLVY